MLFTTQTQGDFFIQEPGAGSQVNRPENQSLRGA